MFAPHSTGGRIAGAVAWWLLLLIGVLVLATANRVFHGGGPEVERLGTASVRECTDYGPVSLEGLGIIYRCTAEVRWSDGETTIERFPAGQLFPSDVGTPVPVYQDLSDGLRDETEIGRNGSARFAGVSFPVTILLGFGVLGIAIAAVSATYRVVRPESPEGQRRTRTRRKAAAEWPVTDADRAAVPTPKLVVRLRLLSGWCALVAVTVPLSTVPRFDAERALHFASPWPQIERALLVDLPSSAAVILGLVLSLFLLVISKSARDDAARVARYGRDYLARDLSGKGSVHERLDERLRHVAAAHRRGKVIGVVVGLLLLASTALAAVHAVHAGGPEAPVPVWLACARDVVLLLLLALAWLTTVETRHERLTRLLRVHPTGERAGGTSGAVRSS
jgi:hypothetical protein